MSIISDISDEELESRESLKEVLGRLKYTAERLLIDVQVAFERLEDLETLPVVASKIPEVTPVDAVVKINKNMIPKPGDILKTDVRVYRWTEVNASPAQSEVLKKAIKEDEAYVFDDTYAYWNGAKYVKLFKKDITKQVMAQDEGGTKFPDPRLTTVLTQIASEEAVKASSNSLHQVWGL